MLGAVFGLLFLIAYMRRRWYGCLYLFLALVSKESFIASFTTGDLAGFLSRPPTQSILDQAIPPARCRHDCVAGLARQCGRGQGPCAFQK